MYNDIINSLLAVVVLAAGGTVVYDIYTPPAATWYSQGKFVKQQEIELLENNFNHNQEEFSTSKIETKVEPQKYSSRGYADFKKTPIPVMDDYPKSPEEAELRERGITSNNITTNKNQFGWVKR